MASLLQSERPAPPSPLSTSTPSSSASPFFPTTTPRRSKMSITQTYYLAHKARAKLSTEAARSDHNLRLLVGHANLLDSLMIELADAEREQESWFNQSVRGAVEPQPQQPQPATLHYASSDDEDDWAIESDSESDDEDGEDEEKDSDSDSVYEAEAEEEEDDEDIVMADAVALIKAPQQLTRVPSRQRRTPFPNVFDTIEEADEDAANEECADLGLSRIPSRASPPELGHDSDTSEDEAMPPSPPQDMLSFPNADKKLDGIEHAHHRDLADGTSPEENHKAFYTEGYYVPTKSPARLSPTFGGVY